MKLPSKRLMFSVALAALFVFGVSGPGFNRFGGVAFAQSQTGGVPASQMSENAFKNIQVLKGIPVDEFMGTMGLFSAALSVCCGDCHTGAGTLHPKWEDDPPKKKMARVMVQMVNNINKTSFGGRQVVTCWTCHRGSEAPATTPTMDAIYSTPTPVPPDVLPAAPPATSGTPPADQILDKYVHALGTADAEAKLTSYTAKGTSLLYDAAVNDPAQIYAKAPDQFAFIVQQREGEMARTFTPHDAWVKLPQTVVGEYPLNASYLEGAKLVGEMAFPWRIKQFFNTWKVSYPATVDGKDVYVVQATSGPKGVLATFYFDKKSGLLNRFIYYANSAVGRVPTQFDYSDYRPVAGVLMPFKIIYGWLSGREEYSLTGYQPNVPIDEAKFQKPPVPAGK